MTPEIHGLPSNLPSHPEFNADIRKTGRLKIDGSKSLSIAAKVLDSQKGESNLKALQNRSGFSWYNRHVTVQYGENFLDINIRSCAKRLGISKQRVFELAKLGSFDTFRSLIDQERKLIAGKLQNLDPSCSVDADPLMNAIYLLRQPLTNALENKRSYSETIRINSNIYEIKVEQDQDQWKIKLHLLSPQNGSVELQDCFIIATKKDVTSFKVDSKALMTTLKENEVSTDFSLQDLEYIKKFVSVNREKFTNLMISQNKTTMFIKPDEANKLPRKLQFNSDGSVYIHFNKNKNKGDKILGEGGYKKAKFALDLINGDLLVAGKMNTSKIAKVIGKEEAEFLKQCKDTPGIAQLIEFVDQDDLEDNLQKINFQDKFPLSDSERQLLIKEIRQNHTHVQNLTRPNRGYQIPINVERSFELSTSQEGTLQIKPKDSNTHPIELNSLKGTFEHLKELKQIKEMEKTKIKTQLKRCKQIPEDEEYQNALCDAIYNYRNPIKKALETNTRWPGAFYGGQDLAIFMGRNLHHCKIYVENGTFHLKISPQRDSPILNLELKDCFDKKLDGQVDNVDYTKYQVEIENTLSSFNLSPQNYRDLTQQIFNIMDQQSYEALPGTKTLGIQLPFEIKKEDENITISTQGDATKKVDLTDFAKSKPKVIFLQPFYNQGDLKIFLENKLNLKTKKMLAHQMLSACANVNKKGIIHCDIKPENFFVSKDKDGNITCKLADFGIAEKKDEFKHSGGTLAYLSPELAKEPTPAELSEKCEKIDAWALGVTLFNLFHPQKEDPAWTKGIQGDISKIVDSLKKLNQKRLILNVKSFPKKFNL